MIFKYKIDDAKKMARELLDQHGFDYVQIEISNRMKRTLGLACFKRGKPEVLKLQAHYICNNSTQDIKDTILHEIAHFIAGYEAGHNYKWQMACVKIGAKPQRCADNTVDTAPAKWKLVCGCCKRNLGERHRRTNMSQRYCRECGRKALGQLKFVRNV